MPGARPLILVVGPESSGTRILTRLLAQHPDVAGDAEGHGDPLDGVWQDLAAGKRPTAPQETCAARVTRRSLPHGAAPGAPARYLDFPDLARFHDWAVGAGYALTLLVTCRSPVPQLASWAANRASVGGDPARARAQYAAAYRHVFAFLAERDVSYRLCPLEALVLDGAAHVRALFGELGLAPFDVDYRPDADLNRKYL